MSKYDHFTFLFICPRISRVTFFWMGEYNFFEELYYNNFEKLVQNNFYTKLL